MRVLLAPMRRSRKETATSISPTASTRACSSLQHHDANPCCSRRPTVVRSPYGNLIGPRFPRTVRCRGNRSRPRTRRVTILRMVEPGLLPKLTGDLDGVDAGRLPPGLFVAGAMDGTVMRTA